MAKKDMSNDTLTRIKKRINEMKAERDKFLPERDMCDAQYDADVYEDNFGKLYVNTPMEQGLIEMDLGRTAWLPSFDVKPDGYRVDVQKLETSRYILDYFLDKECFYKEYRYWRNDRAKYGTGIFYTGIRMEIEEVPVYDGENGDTVDAFFSNNKQKEEKKINRYFTPRNVPIRQFLFDDRYIRQPDFEKCEDCVMMEFVSKEELKQRYDDVKSFDEKVIDNSNHTTAQEESEYGKRPWIDNRVILYHYYNRITKEYTILTDNDVFFEWKMPYADGKLPFVLAQHYPKNDCIYGIGIPRKVRMSKAYKNNMLQYMLDWTKMAAGRVIATSGELTDWEIYSAPWEISIARFTNNISDIRDIDTRMDINWPLASIWQLEKEVRSDTGIDLNSVFEPPAEQLGTVEIIEENKQIRNKAIDELRDFAIDQAYTKVLKNIARFAPQLLKTKTTINVEWEEMGEVTTARPQLQIPNVKIIKDKKWVTIEKEMWEYGYLDFEPWTIDDGIQVRVVTASTYNSKMAVIEKNKVNEMIGKMLELAQIPWFAEVMQEHFPIEQVIQRYKVVNELDDTQLVADTTKDKINKANQEKIAGIQSLLKTAQNVQPEENTAITGGNPLPQWPTQWMPWAETALAGAMPWAWEVQTPL